MKEAVQYIIPYLEDRSEPNQVIYFDGWNGLCASRVLASIAKDPPSSLSNKFDKIIHIDCSRWKSRRALQRTIAQKLSLPQQVMDIFNRQDEEDDFIGLDELSRIEIADVAGEIHRALEGQSCLVLFHNGSNMTINLNNFGIPQPIGRWSSYVVKVLWTFRGRLRAMKETTDAQRVNQSLVERKSSSKKDQPKGKVDNSHIYLYSHLGDTKKECWNELVHEEATEISHYMHKLVVTSEASALCCKYMVLLNYKRIDTLEYNWAGHASNYWVCDGIIQESQQDKAWEVATALHEEMRLEDFSSYKLPRLYSATRWIVASDYAAEVIKPETTSFFLVNRRSLQKHSLPNSIFQQSEQLRVLKLCYCSFSFSSPPFLQCPNIRFLGLDNCKDQEENKHEVEGRQKLEFFQRLWVLDICYTDWELNLPQDKEERITINVREININKGRIWKNNHSWTWKYLSKIHKLRVIEPTCPWETGTMDQFMGMVKLELLNLSGNSTIQVLPSLSGSTRLLSLVLDGCIGVKHVLPGTLPPSLETFSFDAGVENHHDQEAKISQISMAGCSRLVNFILRGSLGNLEELDLSNTSIKALDLRDEIVQVPYLKRIILLECQQLRSILWPKDGMRNIILLSIDTRVGTKADRSTTRHDSLVGEDQEEYCHIGVAITDMRFLQSLVTSGKHFCWEFRSSDELKARRFKVNLFLYSSTSSKVDGQKSNKNMSSYTTGQLVGSPLHQSIIPMTHQTYSEVNIYEAIIGHDASKAWHMQPLDHHIDIGEGIKNDNVVTGRGIEAVIYFMNKVRSLHVHDNSSISTVIPKEEEEKENIGWSLSWCRVERCSNLGTVFNTNYHITCFPELETFWAEDLLVTRCIWTKGRVSNVMDHKSFSKLKAVHLQFCPRLSHVLPLSWFMLSSLETLCIVYCGDLSQVFPVEAEFLKKLSNDNRRGVLEFPKLKHIYLHELPRLQQICEAKMFAPELETITVRGCWSLKRIPATANHRRSHPMVDCEKDWWKKLEWDGKVAGHHPSLFEPRHSKYYKRTMIRGSALR